MNFSKKEKYKTKFLTAVLNKDYDKLYNYILKYLEYSNESSQIGGYTISNQNKRVVEGELGRLIDKNYTSTQIADMYRNFNSNNLYDDEHNNMEIDQFITSLINHLNGDAELKTTIINNYSDILKSISPDPDYHMIRALNEVDFINKRRMTYFDNDEDNINAFRVFRDKITEFYTNTFFDIDNNNIQNLSDFLDYTYHFIYSEILINIGDKIRDYNILNTDYNVKPICGLENIFLVFKGGSMMYIIYNRILKEFTNKINDSIYTYDQMIEIFKIVCQENGMNYENNDIKNFNFDLEKDKILEGTSNNIGTFMNTLINKRFSISDTDYSLYIDADTNERFDILYYFIIPILANSMEQMTKLFDNYYTSIVNGQNYEPPNNIGQVEHTYENYNTTSIILRLLKKIVFNDSIEQITQNDNSGKLARWVVFCNIRLDRHEFSMFFLYEALQIIDLLLYIQKNYQGLTITYNNLKALRKRVEVRIRKLNADKFRILVVNDFYSQDKINRFKDNLFREFNSYRTDNKKKDMMNEKHEKYAHPGKKPEIFIQKYKLNPDYNIPDRNAFTNNTRPSTIVSTSNNPIEHTKITSTNVFTDNKIHYITYNTIINKTRNTNIVVNFDLMRIKFNVSLPEDAFITQPVKNTKIPSEFIDISIPRYDDVNRIRYFYNMKKHNQTIPPIITIPVNVNKISLFAYDAETILEDLEVVLAGQKSVSPWSDLKYEKRLIRLITFIFIANYTKIVDVRESQNNMLNIKKILILFYNLHKHYNKKTILDLKYITDIMIGSNDINKLNVILHIKENIMHYNKKKYFNLDYIINEKIPLYDSFLPLLISLYCVSDNADNQSKFITDSNVYFLQISNKINSDEIENKIKILLNILYDYGFKLCYIFNNITVTTVGGGLPEHDVESNKNISILQNTKFDINDLRLLENKNISTLQNTKFDINDLQLFENKITNNSTFLPFLNNTKIYFENSNGQMDYSEYLKKDKSSQMDNEY